MNHSKKIILALLALSFSILLTISFAFAQNSPVNVGTKYEGLDVNTSIFNNIKQNPPDVQVAVGPNHIFEMVNVKGEIRDKTGHFVETVSLDQLFGFKSTDSLTSPKILYDNSSGRWFASLEDAQNDTVGIAVSPGNDPTATNWHVYHVNYQTEQECPDQPKIGVSDDKFVVSTNDINFNHNGDCFAISVSKDGAEYFVFNKNLMLDGNFVFNDFFSNSDFAVSPVQSLSSTQTLYMVSDGSGASGSSIQLYKLTGQVPSVIVDKSSLSLNPHIVQPAAALQDSAFNSPLSTGDVRVLDAKWYHGNLWLSANDGCKPDGITTLSCARLIELNTNNTSISQNFDISDAGHYYYYPSLTIDSFGGIGIVVGFSNSTTFPSLMVTGQAANDPKNTYRPLSLLIDGTNYEDDEQGPSGSSRYGDYFGAALDPSNSTNIWVGGEFNELTPVHLGPSWTTYIGSINFDCIPPPFGDWTISSNCTLAKSALAPANVKVQPGAVLTIQNGISLNIDFKHFHLLVNPGGGVYIAPGGNMT